MLTARPSGSSAIPVCCSTVTPGKLATFWRSPVRRLKSVVLPELGGPTSATVRTAAGRASCATGSTTAIVAIAALAHGILRVPGLVRIFKRRAVSRRRAISEPSTWKTRGSPPGALNPAVIFVCRGRNQVPSGGGHLRWADRCGRGWRHRLFAGPPGLRAALPTGCCHSVATWFQYARVRNPCQELAAASRAFFSPWCLGTHQVRQNKG